MAPQVLSGRKDKRERRGLKGLPAIPVQKVTKETLEQQDQPAPRERLAPQVLPGLQLLHPTAFDRLRPTALSPAMPTKPWYRYFALRGVPQKARNARPHQR